MMYTQSFVLASMANGCRVVLFSLQEFIWCWLYDQYTFGSPFISINRSRNSVLLRRSCFIPSAIYDGHIFTSLSVPKCTRGGSSNASILQNLQISSQFYMNLVLVFFIHGSEIKLPISSAPALSHNQSERPWKKKRHLSSLKSAAFQQV